MSHTGPVLPKDPRYPSLSRGFNQRWLSKPDWIQTVATPEQARSALQAAYDAVRKAPSGDPRRRITVRSGGHCYENFVCAPDVRVIIDVSPMCGMHQEQGEVCIESGATNWHTYSHLYPATGRALPGGTCYSVGLGGHIPGGGYGMLSRAQGLVVDYLTAVEVARIDDKGKAQLVKARIDDEDLARRALAWAHTGGGGGNFGIATRFWFRGVPEPPAQVWLCGVQWDWAGVSRAEFAELLRVYGQYFKDSQKPDHPAYGLFTLLKLNHISNGKIALTAQIPEDPHRPGRAEGVIKEFLRRIDATLTPPAAPQTVSTGEHPATGPRLFTPKLLPWLTATQTLNGSGTNRYGKYKSAYIRDLFTRAQVDGMWDYLTGGRLPDYRNANALIQIDSYGGAVNRPEFHGLRTAAPQRDSILKMQYQAYWEDPGEEAHHLEWIRDTYRATFAETGGVPQTTTLSRPVNTDGCYINYPDVDLCDTATWNTSGEPWTSLYYKDAYPYLQLVKKRWDPLDVFRSQQSVRLPDSSTGTHDLKDVGIRPHRSS